MAVGSFHGYAQQQDALAERPVDGSWRPVPTAPLPGGDDQANFASVSCVAANDCVAVGSVENQAGSQLPLAEVYDGVKWTASLPALPAADGSGSLAGVSCPSAADCVAVGDATSIADGTQVELAYGFDGHAWTAQSTPAASGEQLNAVSCVSGTLCWAVGEASGATLTQRFNGSGWTLLTTPSPIEGALEGVSCPTATSCVAVVRRASAWPVSVRCPRSSSTARGSTCRSA